MQRPTSGRCTCRVQKLERCNGATICSCLKNWSRTSICCLYACSVIQTPLNQDLIGGDVPKEWVVMPTAQVDRFPTVVDIPSVSEEKIKCRYREFRMCRNARRRQSLETHRIIFDKVTESG